MATGWVKVHRQALENGWLKNHRLWAFLSYCLLKASHKETTVTVGYQRVQLLPGQFVFGRKQAAADLDMTERQIRTVLNRLISGQNLSVQTTNKFSIVTVVNWRAYQGDSDDIDHQNVQQVTSKCPASDHKQELKNEKKKEIPSSSGDEAGAKVADFFVTKKKKKMTGPRLDSFLQFWEVFNYKSGKAEAADAWLEIPLLNKAVVSQILSAAKVEAQDRDAVRTVGKTPKMAQGWISGRRWEDEAMTTSTPSPEDKLTTMDPAKAEVARRKLAKYNL